jgi:hypothetical protein
MAAENVWDGPIGVVIDAVDGLPPSHELVHIFPPLGVPYRLDFADRNSQGVMVLRQLTRTEGRHSVRLRFRVVEPPILRELPERVIEFTLVGRGPVGGGQ